MTVSYKYRVKPKKTSSRKSRVTKSDRIYKHLGGASGASGTSEEFERKVNLYFLYENPWDLPRSSTTSSAIKVSFLKPIYSDYDKLNITQFGQMLDGDLGINFPAKELMVKDIKFETITKSGGKWENNDLYNINMYVGDGKSIRMKKMVNSEYKYITGAADANVNATTPLSYPEEGLNLNNVEVRGMNFVTMGYISSKDSWPLGDVPPGAPAGTPKANMRMSFTVLFICKRIAGTNTCAVGDTIYPIS